MLWGVNRNTCQKVMANSVTPCEAPHAHKEDCGRNVTAVSISSER